MSTFTFFNVLFVVVFACGVVLIGLALSELIDLSINKKVVEEDEKSVDNKNDVE